MLREERDPAFWIAVAEHPAVKDAMIGFDPSKMGAILADPRVLPLASEHGGFLVINLDGVGRTCEFHTLFTPEGWGREVLFAAREAVARMMRTAHVLMTYEIEGRWRTRPPKTFGFKPCGPFELVIGLSLRTWILTRLDWETKCRLHFPPPS